MESTGSATNSETLLIRRARLTSGQTVDLSLAKGVINRINDSNPDADQVIDAAGRLISPGFVELQVNGAGDVDFTANPGQLWRGCSTLGSQGITSVLPTVITSSADVRAEAIATVAQRPANYVGPNVLGLHFEGPWLAKARCGAHPIECLAEPDLGEVR
ncbi:MAG: N-acetylglucosamine-6-phosphate deacetylase, partial [Myxococcota bacterium]